MILQTLEEFCGLQKRARDDKVDFVSSARDDAVVSSLLGRREEVVIVCLSAKKGIRRE